MRRIFITGSGVLGMFLALGADSKPLYQQDFSNLQPGVPPDELLILDGQFAVKDEGGNRFLELPGAPLDSFGVLFGPSEPAGVQVSARILATRQGRKFPTFAAGLNGVGGFKVRVVPAKTMIELTRGDDMNMTVLAGAPFDWSSGQWTSLKLQVRKSEGGMQIRARVWQGANEPKDWQLTAQVTGEAPPGRAGIWGMPFASTPIRFDDLKIMPAE